MLRKVRKSHWRYKKSLLFSGNKRGAAGCILVKVWGLAELCCASSGALSGPEALADASKNPEKSLAMREKPGLFRK